MDDFMKLMMLSGNLNHITEPDLFTAETKKPIKQEIDTCVAGAKETVTATMSSARPQNIQGGNADALIKRGYMALEDRDWDSAMMFFDNSLNIDAENAVAYLGITMARYQCTNISSFQGLYVANKYDLLEDKDFKKVKRFASKELLKNLLGVAEDVCSTQEESLSRIRARIEPAQKLLIPGFWGLIGLSTNGYIYHAGEHWPGSGTATYRQFFTLNAGHLCDEEIVSADGYGDGIIALRSDGEVVLFPSMRRVPNWKNIIQVAGGNFHLLGLTNEGKVLADGNNEDGQCNVSTWSNIVAIAACYNHTIGLRADGTVVATGNNDYGQCDVSHWTGICSISTCFTHTVGLRIDGTVVATKYRKGSGYHGQCEVEDWRDIVAVTADYESYTVGLKANGTLVAAGGRETGSFKISQSEAMRWKNLVSVRFESHYICGLHEDGTVSCTGDDYFMIDETYKKWRLFENLDDIAGERVRLKGIGKKRVEERQAKYEAARQPLILQRKTILKEIAETEELLNNLKGIFQGKRRRELELKIKNLKSKKAEVEKQITEIGKADI